MWTEGGEVMRGRSKLHNGVCNLYSLPSPIRMGQGDEMGRACSTNGVKGVHVR
jgi:hypothetical protein